MGKARHLTDMQVNKAAKWTDLHLAEIGETRDTLHAAWLQMPGGKAARADGHPAARAEATSNDRLFINSIIAGPAKGDPEWLEGLQTYLFSDDGDLLAKVPARSATAKERDGYFGPMSDRRLELWRESHCPILLERPPEGDQTFIINGRPVELPGSGYRVVKPGQEGSLEYPAAQKGLGTWGRGTRKSKRTIASFAHWTAGFTAKGGRRVLGKRGYPTTVILDNPNPTDGLVTVYQCFDPMVHAGTHGGTWPNRRSWLSGDFVTPAYLKYADRIRRIAGKEPSRIRGHRNNGRSWVLGYWLGQVKAWLAITTAVAAEANMKPRIWTGGLRGMPDFFPSQKVYPRGTITNGTNGAHGNVLTHLEASTKKWDCAGLWEFVAVAALVDPEILECAPWLYENFKLDDPWWEGYLKRTRSEWHCSELFD